MKKTKNILILVLCFICLFVITGCGNKKALTKEEFKTLMEKENFKVEDSSSKMSEFDYIDKLYIAYNDDSYQIEFYELIDEDSAITFFNNNKESFENSKSSNSYESSVSKNNSDKYTLLTNNKYKVISRIDNTAIFVNVDKSFQDEVDSLLEKLGY